MASRIPTFSTNCQYSTEMIGDYWYIYLKSSGSFQLAYAKSSVDIFLQGGGGGGASSDFDNGGGGGAGGYQTTMYAQRIANNAQDIIIGFGGASNSYGGRTSAFGFDADGGSCGGVDGDMMPGGADGTGAGGKGGWYWAGGNSGENGANGENGRLAFGTGDTYYGAGGGGGGAKFSGRDGAGGETGGGAGKSGNATPNTGSGGGGARDHGGAGGTGGSGIVILRGKEDDFLPVYFNGTHLSEIYFNGERLNGLIYGGQRIFARLKSWLRNWCNSCEVAIA